MDAFHSSAYLNGAFLPLKQVSISPLDRGFLFADGIYEVIPVYNGQLFRLQEHLNRLQNGLKAIDLKPGLSAEDWQGLLMELVKRNGGGNLAAYLQVTRGAPAIRDHGFPPPSTEPTVFAMVTALTPYSETVYRKGIAVITLEDIRWGACHIKSIALLPNVLARQQALRRDATDAILVRDGLLTEGSASNLFVVKDGILHTPLSDQRILPGITRTLILELATANSIPYREENLPLAKLETADEAWLTSSTKEIVPIANVDGRPMGTEAPGPLWRQMVALLQAYKHKVCS